MIRAFIFDFDGLILETETPDLTAWQELYAEQGQELPFSAWVDYIGRHAGFFDPAADLEKRTGRPLDRKALHTRHRERYNQLCSVLPLLPGVKPVLETVHKLGLKLAIASSGFHRTRIRGHLERTGVDGFFLTIVCGEDLQRVKPFPDPYLKAMALLGVGPEETVALEDSPNGIQAAKEAGCFCIAVPNPLTRDLPLDRADLVLPTLEGFDVERFLKTR